MSRSSSTERLVAALVLALAVAALFGRVLGYEFVYDDRVLVEGNAALADWGTLPTALTHDLFHLVPVRASPYWRPLVSLSYYVDHAIGGGAAWAFHLDNLVALVAAGLALFVLLRQHVELLPAALGTALFVAHPLLVEPTANIASRTDLYCAALAFWALSSRSSWAACVLTFLACCSKEPAVFLPLVALAIDRRDRRCLWMLVAVLAYVVLRAVVVDVDSDASASGAFEAGGRALFLLSRPVLPVPLAPAFEVDFLGPLGWLPIVALGALAAWKLRGLQAGGAVLIAACVLPASGVLQAHPRYGDGLLVLAVAGFVMIVARAPRWIGLAVLPFLLLGQVQVGQWHDERALWEASHERLPDDQVIRLRLARTIVEEDPARSLELLAGAQFVDDPHERRSMHEVRSRAWMLQGRDDLARDNAILAAAPEVDARWATAVACVASPAGQGTEYCEWALVHSPEDPNLHNSAGIHAENPGVRTEHFRRACELSPDDGPFCANAARSELDLPPGVEHGAP